MSRFDALLSGSARLRRRVETARAVRLRKAPLRRTLPVRALLLAATVILALGVSWAVRKARPSGEIATTAPPGPISTAPAAISTPPILATGSARNVFSCVLAAGLTRGTSEAATLPIPKGTETVELRLPLEADAFSSYHVDLRTEAGAAVLEQHGLRSRKEKAKPVLVVEVPATNLPQGTYVLTLSGIAGRGATETLDQYRFRVPAR